MQKVKITKDLATLQLILRLHKRGTKEREEMREKHSYVEASLTLADLSIAEMSPASDENSYFGFAFGKF